MRLDSTNETEWSNVSEQHNDAMDLCELESDLGRVMVERCDKRKVLKKC